MATQRLDDAVIDAALDRIRAGKRDELILDELRLQDLEYLAWSGGPSHLRAVAKVGNQVSCTRSAPT